MNYCVSIIHNYFDNPLVFSHFHRYNGVQEKNEGVPVEPQKQGIEDSTTKTQSSSSKKRTLQESVDIVESSQSKFQRFELDTEDSYKRWDLPLGLAIYLNK